MPRKQLNSTLVLFNTPLSDEDEMYFGEDMRAQGCTPSVWFNGKQYVYCNGPTSTIRSIVGERGYVYDRHDVKRLETIAHNDRDLNGRGQAARVFLVDLAEAASAAPAII